MYELIYPPAMGYILPLLFFFKDGFGINLYLTVNMLLNKNEKWKTYIWIVPSIDHNSLEKKLTVALPTRACCLSQWSLV